MIKYILLSLIALSLVSCTQVNTKGEKTITQDGDTIAEVDISLSKIDALNSLAEIDEPKTDRLLFKASGTEPGWMAEIYENKLRLVVDYGNDSLILNNKFEDLDNNLGYVFDNQSNKIAIKIVNKPCTDEGSGAIKDRNVIIIYKAKTYKGCGSFVK